MARIAGVNIPEHKHAEIALTAIYGVGRQLARKICDKTGVLYTKKVKDMGNDELDRIRAEVSSDRYIIEGDLRRDVNLNIKRLRDLGFYRGIRHRLGLPLRGQRTRNNARTRKGPRRSMKKR